MNYLKQKTGSPPRLKPNRILNLIKNSKPLSLPKIKESFSQKDYVTKSLNPFYFSFRLSKPLKGDEKLQNISDYTYLLTKVEREKLSKLKEIVKKIEKEKLREYAKANKHIIKYSNMLPVSIWHNCEEEYEEYKKKYKNIINSKLAKNKKIKINDNKDKNRHEEISIKKSLSARNIIYNDKRDMNNIDNIYMEKSNNFKKCIQKINIKQKFENQGLNKFIKYIEKQIYLNIKNNNLKLNN